MKRAPTAFAFIVFASLACTLGTAATQPIETATSFLVQNEAATAVPVSSADSSIPISLDVGTGTYKGLPLGLQDTGAPVVTAVDGVIGLACIGMSNSNQECEDFIAKLEVNLRDRSTRKCTW